MTKKMLIYGAGNIGRGFLADLGYRSGYACVFVDVRKDIVDALNAKQSYTQVVVGNQGIQKNKIENVRAIHALDTDTLVQEIQETQLITTAVGKNALIALAPTLLQGLLKRAQGGNAEQLPVSVMACENIHNNTDYLKSLLFASLSPDEQHLVEQMISFPNTIVDRIVPNYVGDELLDVCVEEYYQLAVDANTVGNHFALEGVEVSADLSAIADQKLFTLNGGHALTAYLGALAGKKYIHEAIETTAIRHIIAACMQEVTHVLCAQYPTITPESHTAYSARIMQRFANVHLYDDVDRVARDPIRKLAPNDRLLYPFTKLLDGGITPAFLAAGIAGALQYKNPQDGQAVTLQQEIHQKGIDHVITQRLGVENPHHRALIQAPYALRNI